MSGRCGIGLRPSASASAPVSTATTPGSAMAAAASMARMRACGVRRAHHDRIGLAGKIEIVAEMTVPDQQRGIFLADDRLAEYPFRVCFSSSFSRCYDSYDYA